MRTSQADLPILHHCCFVEVRLQFSIPTTAVHTTRVWSSSGINYRMQDKMKSLALFIVTTLHALVVAGAAEVPDYQEQDTDALLHWKPPVNFPIDYPYALSGFDDENSPIYFLPYGKWDVRKAIEDGQEREMKLYFQQMLRRAIEGMKIKSTPDDPVSQLNMLIDMEGYDSNQATSERAVMLNMWLARNIEQAWRGKLKIGFMLNTNFLFQGVFDMMKPLLGPNVYKVEVFGNNRDHWLPHVLKAFPRVAIPEYYGGFPGNQMFKTFE